LDQDRTAVLVLQQSGPTPPQRPDGTNGPVFGPDEKVKDRTRLDRRNTKHYTQFQ
jgi:hypothetical protein